MWVDVSVFKLPFPVNRLKKKQQNRTHKKQWLQIQLWIMIAVSNVFVCPYMSFPKFPTFPWSVCVDNSFCCSHTYTDLRRGSFQEVELIRFVFCSHSFSLFFFLFHFLSSSPLSFFSLFLSNSGNMQDLACCKNLNTASLSTGWPLLSLCP